MLVEINENFTAKDKRIVRNDWNNYFKSLKRYRDVEICNRLGPLVISIFLKMGRLSDYYTPIYSVHNLCREFSYNTLIATLRLGGNTISPQNHNNMYIQEAQKIEEKAYIPLAGDVSIDEITDGYKRFFKTPFKSGFTEYEDFALICGLTRDKKRIEDALNFVYSELKTWEEGHFRREGSFENMFKNLERRVWDPDELEKTVEAEIINHKLQKIPVREILF